MLMRVIDGIIYVKKRSYALCHINGLTNEIKKLIRERLSFICYGRSCSESGRALYNYSNTLQEFLLRYESKSANIQKGMIGELLSHLIINELFPEYNVMSPFFNKEERNIKKGFDVVLSSKEDYSIWITEVKSGELHKDKNADGTSCDLLGTAKGDLIDRLNKENRALWLNAINDAKIAYERYTDIKDSILQILEDYGERAGTQKSYSSTEMNVFLVSALFASLSDKIKPSVIENKAIEMETEKLFKRIFVLSIPPCVRIVVIGLRVKYS